jgi:hypothetical protein
MSDRSGARTHVARLPITGQHEKKTFVPLATRLFQQVAEKVRLDQAALLPE